MVQTRIQAAIEDAQTRSLQRRSVFQDVLKVITRQRMAFHLEGHQTEFKGRKLEDGVNHHSYKDQVWKTSCFRQQDVTQLMSRQRHFFSKPFSQVEAVSIVKACFVVGMTADTGFTANRRQEACFNITFISDLKGGSPPNDHRSRQDGDQRIIHSEQGSLSCQVVRISCCGTYETRGDSAFQTTPSARFGLSSSASILRPDAPVNQGLSAIAFTALSVGCLTTYV